MKLFRILILVFITTFGAVGVFADTDKTKDILEKAKEINQKVKKQQAEKAANIKSEIGEEPLPLNDPFVGDASLGGQSTVSVITNESEARQELSLIHI